MRSEPSEPMAIAELGDDRGAGKAMARPVANVDGALSTKREIGSRHREGARGVSGNHNVIPIARPPADAGPPAFSDEAGEAAARDCALRWKREGRRLSGQWKHRSKRLAAPSASVAAPYSLI
jgi:hypothetical protein